VIRGVAGSHKKTMHAIKCIDEFKKKNGLAYPAVGINTVIVKDTIEHIGELVDHLLDFKAHVSGIRLQYLTYITEETFNQHVETLKRQYPDMHYFYWEKFVMHDTGIHAGKLLALFEAVKKKTARAMVPLHISWNFTEHQINTWYTTSLPVLHTCGFLRAFLVLPNGDVPLCDFIRYPIGNIKHGTLKDIWKNMQRKKFKRLISQKLLPGCERCCHLQ
jgi:MoaA/NifB/PqqE/SkfB family radical SAM enzyme